MTLSQSPKMLVTVEISRIGGLSIKSAFIPWRISRWTVWWRSSFDGVSNFFSQCWQAWFLAGMRRFAFFPWMWVPMWRWRLAKLLQNFEQYWQVCEVFFIKLLNLLASKDFCMCVFMWFWSFADELATEPQTVQVCRLPIFCARGIEGTDAGSILTWIVMWWISSACESMARKQIGHWTSGSFLGDS